jgi:hypothetical protein
VPVPARREQSAWRLTAIRCVTVERGSLVGEGDYVVSAAGRSMTATTAGVDDQLRRFQVTTVRGMSSSTSPRPRRSEHVRHDNPHLHRPVAFAEASTQNVAPTKESLRMVR